MKAPFSVLRPLEKAGVWQTKSRKPTYTSMYFFRKKDPDRPVNFNIKVMHWINRIAILVFLAGIIYKIIEWLTK